MDIKEIQERYQEELYNFLLGKLASREQAEDLLQELWLKLYKALEKGQQVDNYRSWLFQVARNTIADFYRKQKTLPERDWKHLLNTPLEESAGPCVCDLTGFVIQHYLPDIYRDALYLSDVERLPQRAVAEKLGLSLPALKSRVLRGREKLRALVLECVEVRYNEKGAIVDYQLRPNCELPKELLEEMERINLFL